MTLFMIFHMKIIYISMEIYCFLPLSLLHNIYCTTKPHHITSQSSLSTFYNRFACVCVCVCVCTSWIAWNFKSDLYDTWFLFMFIFSALFNNNDSFSLIFEESIDNEVWEMPIFITPNMRFTSRSSPSIFWKSFRIR